VRGLVFVAVGSDTIQPGIDDNDGGDIDSDDNCPRQYTRILCDAASSVRMVCCVIVGCPLHVSSCRGLVSFNVAAPLLLLLLLLLLGPLCSCFFLSFLALFLQLAFQLPLLGFGQGLCLCR